MEKQDSSNSPPLYHVKLHAFGQIRLLSLKDCKYEDFLDAVCAIFPNLRGEQFYYDDDGDKILFGTDAEIATMFSFFKIKYNSLVAVVHADGSSNKNQLTTDHASFLIGTDELDYQRHAFREMQNSTQKMSIKSRQLHAHVVCDGCNGEVRGRRYKCLVCDDYDLCESCEQKDAHPDHAMMRLLKPLSELRAQRQPFIAPHFFRSGLQNATSVPPKRCPFLKRRDIAGLGYDFRGSITGAQNELTPSEKQELCESIKSLPEDKISGLNVLLEVWCESKTISREGNNLEIINSLKPNVQRELLAHVRHASKLERCRKCRRNLSVSIARDLLSRRHHHHSHHHSAVAAPDAHHQHLQQQNAAAISAAATAHHQHLQQQNAAAISAAAAAGDLHSCRHRYRMMKMEELRYCLSQAEKKSAAAAFLHSKSLLPKGSTVSTNSTSKSGVASAATASVLTTNSSSVKNKDIDDLRKAYEKLAKMHGKHPNKEQSYRDRAFRALHRLGTPQQQNREGNGSSQSAAASKNDGGVEYLKSVAHQLQQQMLTLGIDCAATIKDHQGNTQEHLPFLPPPTNTNVRVSDEQNVLNPETQRSPAGILERPQFLAMRKEGEAPGKKAHEMKLDELRDAIKQADKNIAQKENPSGLCIATQKNDSETQGTEKAKTDHPTAPPLPEIDPHVRAAVETAQGVLLGASKITVDGLEKAAQIAVQLINDWDPVKGEQAKRGKQNFVNDTRNGAEKFAKDLKQNGDEFMRKYAAFQDYLKHLQFPCHEKTSTVNKAEENVAKNSGTTSTQSSEMGANQKAAGNVEEEEPKVEKEEKSVESSGEKKVESELSVPIVAAGEQSAPVEIANNKSESTTTKTLTRAFSQLSVCEQQNVGGNTDEGKTISADAGDLLGADESSQRISFSSSDSDVELLDEDALEAVDDEVDEDAVVEQSGKKTVVAAAEGEREQLLEVEPSLPPSLGSSNGSLKRRLAEMEKSTNTAIAIDEEYGGNVPMCDSYGNLSRCCSFSSFTSCSTNSSGWLEVKQDSFKQLCDTYEKRRRLEDESAGRNGIFGYGENNEADLIVQTTKEGNLDVSMHTAIGIEEEGEAVEKNANEKQCGSTSSVVTSSGKQMSIEAFIEKPKVLTEPKKLEDAEEKAKEEEEVTGSGKQMSIEAFIEKKKLEDAEEKEEEEEEVKKDEAIDEAKLFEDFLKKKKSEDNANSVNGEGNAAVANFLPMEEGGGIDFEHNHRSSGNSSNNVFGANPFEAMAQPENNNQQTNGIKTFADILNAMFGQLASSPAPQPSNSQAAKNSNIEIPVRDATPPVLVVPSAPVENGTQTEQNNSPAKNIYPDLVAASLIGNGVVDELCTAGAPHSQSASFPSGTQHSRRCPWEHPDQRVQEIANQLVAMGYDNCNGWLYRLAEGANGDVNRVIELIEQDQLHVERQLLADM